MYSWIKHIFLDFITTVIKVEFYLCLHNCHLPIELFFHILHPFSYGISAFCLDLSKFCELKRDAFLFRSERDDFLFVFWIFCGVFLFLFLFLCSQKKKACKDSLYSSCCWGTEQSVWTSAQWICLCFEDRFELSSLKDTHLEDWGVKAQFPLGRVGDPKAQRNKQAPRREGLRIVFRMCICGRKETKWNSHLASL